MYCMLVKLESSHTLQSKYVRGAFNASNRYQKHVTTKPHEQFNFREEKDEEMQFLYILVTMPVYSQLSSDKYVVY